MWLIAKSLHYVPTLYVHDVIVREEVVLLALKDPVDQRVMEELLEEGEVQDQGALMAIQGDQDRQETWVQKEGLEYQGVQENQDNQDLMVIQ